MKAAKFMQVDYPLAMACKVEITIKARPEEVWKLLTDAEGFGRWNSTVSRIEGRIGEGERIRIHVPGTKRTFTPKVSAMVTNQCMTWSDGLPFVFKGTRTFQLKPVGYNGTKFIMKEQFEGLVFGMVKGMLPDFQGIFETYAQDVKREAERLAIRDKRPYESKGAQLFNYMQNALWA